MSARREFAAALARLRAVAAGLSRPLIFMEVCGTHTVAAARCGLPSLLPDGVSLRSGPGCPVCVTPAGEIDLLCELAARPRVTLCTYGDMVRVPGGRGSLERARSLGADVRVVTSALDAVRIAIREPRREVVLAAVGFETTAPATAAVLLQAERDRLGNFSVLAVHRRIVPAMAALLAGGELALSGFLCPGHVSVVIGAAAYAPLVRRLRVSCVVAGFEPVHLVRGLARLVELSAAGTPALANEYPEAVRPEGNPAARAALATVFLPAAARWRGLGTIARSGLAIRPRFARWDARRRYELVAAPDREPAGCACGDVLAGRLLPPDCPLYGRPCTPVRPVGPCMVSAEGTCGAWMRHVGPGRPPSPAAGIPIRGAEVGP